MGHRPQYPCPHQGEGLNQLKGISGFHLIYSVPSMGLSHATLKKSRTRSSQSSINGRACSQQFAGNSLPIPVSVTFITSGGLAAVTYQDQLWLKGMSCGSLDLPQRCVSEIHPCSYLPHVWL